MQKVSCQTGVICAEYAGVKHGKKLYYAHAVHGFPFTVVKNADHNFEGAEMQITLLTETVHMTQAMSAAIPKNKPLHGSGLFLKEQLGNI